MPRSFASSFAFAPASAPTFDGETLTVAFTHVNSCGRVSVTSPKLDCVVRTTGSDANTTEVVDTNGVSGTAHVCGSVFSPGDTNGEPSFANNGSFADAMPLALAFFTCSTAATGAEAGAEAGATDDGNGIVVDGASTPGVPSASSRPPNPHVGNTVFSITCVTKLLM
jgi:hypothetical protein